MDTLRSAAISVFLDHTLSAAVSCKSIVEQRTAHKATIQAVELWIKFCRNAQSLCGVFGLVAIDRAEDHLKYCLAYELSFGSPRTWMIGSASVLTYRSGRCYVRALLAQHRLDYTAANLWSYAGEVLNHVLGATCALECDPFRARYEEPVPWRNDLQSFKDTYCTQESMAHEELSSLVEGVLQKFNAAAAYRCIYFMFKRYGDALPPDNVAYWTKWGELNGFVNPALFAGKDITQAIDYTQLALNSTSMTAKALQMLWRHCASLMLSASQEWKVGDHDTWSYTVKRPAKDTVERVGAFAETGHEVAKLVEAAQRLSAESDSEEVHMMWHQMDEVFDHIKNACQANEPLPTLAAINDLVATLEVRLQALLRVKAPEQAAMERCTAQAARIDSSQSPVHALLKKCWESAAEQMRLAVTASTAEQRQLHKHRSALLESLALGPITTALHYHAKASLSTTAAARLRWAEAGRWLMEAAAPTLQRFCAATEVAEPRYAEQYMAAVERSEIMAALADCCERSETAKDVDPALHRLYEAEYKLRKEMWDYRWGCSHFNQRCHCHAEKLISMCKSALSRCVHPQLLTPALPLRPPPTLPIPTAAPAAPSVEGGSAHSPEEECAARTERLTWLCLSLRAFLVYYRLKLSQDCREKERLVAIALCALLAPAVASAFGSIEAWRSKFGPYPPGHYLQCVHSLLEPLKEGDVQKGLCWMAAARFLSTCSATSDLFDRSVQREVYNRLLQKAGAPQEAERLPLSAGQVEVASLEAESARIERVVAVLVEIARRLHSYEMCARDSHDFLPNSRARRHKAAAEQYGHAARYLILSIAHTLRGVAVAAGATGGERGDFAMKVVPNHSAYTITDAQQPITDLVAERYIQAAQSDHARRSRLWNQAAESTAKALRDGTTEEQCAVALAEAEALAARAASLVSGSDESDSGSEEDGSGTEEVDSESVWSESGLGSQEEGPGSHEEEGGLSESSSNASEETVEDGGAVTEEGEGRESAASIAVAAGDGGVEGSDGLHHGRACVPEGAAQEDAVRALKKPRL